MNELYEYFIERYPELIDEIEDWIQIGWYELYLEMVDGRQLSREVGIDTYQMSRYRYGVNIPNEFMIHKIAKALDCSVDDFYYI